VSLKGGCLAPEAMRAFRIRELDWVAAAFDRDKYPVTARATPGLRYPCPCCQYPMLSERGGYEICHLCGWEDDGQDEPEADRVFGGPNYELSLTVAKVNFRLHLEKHAPGSKHFRQPTEIEVNAKRQIMAAFDALSTGEADRSRRWQEILDGERILGEELHRRVTLIEAFGWPKNR
jgi:hypothetical protein